MQTPRREILLTPVPLCLYLPIILPVSIGSRFLDPRGMETAHDFPSADGLGVVCRTDGNLVAHCSEIERLSGVKYSSVSVI